MINILINVIDPELRYSQIIWNKDNVKEQALKRKQITQGGYDENMRARLKQKVKESSDILDVQDLKDINIALDDIDDLA
jgi:hypothetical protein